MSKKKILLTELQRSHPQLRCSQQLSICRDLNFAYGFSRANRSFEELATTKELRYTKRTPRTIRSCPEDSCKYLITRSGFYEPHNNPCSTNSIPLFLPSCCSNSTKIKLILVIRLLAFSSSPNTNSRAGLNLSNPE
jgi:hypothetical protein